MNEGNNGRGGNWMMLMGNRKRRKKSVERCEIIEGENE